MPLNAAELVAFVASSDLAASAVFYGGVLGLPTIESSELSTVYDANGTQLRVTAVDDVAGARYTVLGWRVDDISETTQMLRAAGVSFNRYPGMEQDDDAVWTAPGGSRIAWFDDPDGNTLSLQQAP